MVSETVPTLPLDATMREAVVLLAERRGIAIVRRGDAARWVLTAGDLTRLMERMTMGPARSGARRDDRRRPKVATLGELGSAACTAWNVTGSCPCRVR
jgi:hypothetical protein